MKKYLILGTAFTIAWILIYLLAATFPIAFVIIGVGLTFVVNGWLENNTVRGSVDG